MDHIIDVLKDKISGEIVFSDNPGKALRKWRRIFEVSQKELADKLGISPSVISDYESDRRKSPGISFVRKVITALFEIDKDKGYKTISKYRDLISGINLDAIIDMKEFTKSLKFKELVEMLEGDVIVETDKVVNGYTIVDSIKAILTLNAYDFYKLYGYTSERSLIFTKVSTGRSPMVAVRVANLKPSVVVLHGLKRVDEIAVKLAEADKVGLIVTNLPVEDMVDRLRGVE
ncbi:helix-turn-helix domain-containing protein [Archaeoglobus profundus]|uniref:Transcriptional regulator, XRE family n=1 Tax=Archaeoglobus profundus (strain DSM 5631 / JCM 9629 / NBRC 100127 / Av18) TaxID=572546 RepID=D2RFZ0_ARCPA|nr:helix-turn-helix domain-containing protein [Archaeoglobus profundus]ADB57215.1 transcriptional regulator, XRE family [Archaeoglobus profundus DSM 5631]